MSSACSEARLLIGLSLGKICRGGGGLRRNLLVATVLQKARHVFMKEAKLTRQYSVADSAGEICRVNAPDAPAKSENKVTQQTPVLCDDSRLRGEPQKEEEIDASCDNRTTSVKRPCEDRQEVKRARYSPAGCGPSGPPPSRPPHLLAIAV